MWQCGALIKTYVLPLPVPNPSKTYSDTIWMSSFRRALFPVLLRGRGRGPVSILRLLANAAVRPWTGLGDSGETRHTQHTKINLSPKEVPRWPRALTGRWVVCLLVSMWSQDHRCRKAAYSHPKLFMKDRKTTGDCWRQVTRQFYIFPASVELS